MKTKKSHWKNLSSNALPCLYCGVDSGPTVTFFLWIIGSVLISFVCILIWAKANGKFRADQETKSAEIPLRSEQE